MNFGEKIKDVGRTIIGEGREVAFKNAAQEYAMLHSVSLEEATSILVQERLQHIKDDIDRNGVYTENSVEDFTAAFKELFERGDLDTFREYADDPTIFIPTSPITVLPSDISSVEKDYKTRFNKKAPSSAVLRDTAEQTKLAYELLSRFQTDPRITSASDIEAVIRSNPELAADIGRFMQAKEGIDRHNRSFGRELQFQESWENTKKNAQESLQSMVFSAPANLTSSVFKEGQKVFKTGNYAQGMVNMSFAFGKFFGQEIYQGTKILGNLTGTLARYINTQRS